MLCCCAVLLCRSSHALCSSLEGEIDLDEAEIAVDAPTIDVDDDDGTDAMRLAAAKRALKHAKQDAAADAQAAK